MSLDSVPLLKHLDLYPLNGSSKFDFIPLAPGKETGQLLGPDVTDKASSNASVAENPVHDALDETRLSPEHPGVFWNIRPSDKLDREIDNMSVVSWTMCKKLFTSIFSCIYLLKKKMCLK